MKTASLFSAEALIRKILGRETGVHAVLLYGSDSSNRDELALLLAQGWLCTQPQRPCGTCQACTNASKLTCVDMLTIEPKESGVITLDYFWHVQDGSKKDAPVPVSDFLRSFPLVSPNKVVWVKEAERMNSRSANSFLKMLEEPMPYGKYVITTSALSQILPTVVSRCLVVKVEMPSLEELAELHEDLNLPALAAAEGSVLQARRIVRDQSEAKIIGFSKSLPSKKPVMALRMSEEFRHLVDDLADELNCPKKKAASIALGLLGRMLLPVRPDWVPEVIETQRRIQQNAGQNYQFDRLFVKILASRT